jgi:hypothetical protein
MVEIMRHLMVMLGLLSWEKCLGVNGKTCQGFNLRTRCNSMFLITFLFHDFNFVTTFDRRDLTRDGTLTASVPQPSPS